MPDPIRPEYPLDPVADVGSPCPCPCHVYAGAAGARRDCVPCNGTGRIDHARPASHGIAADDTRPHSVMVRDALAFIADRVHPPMLECRALAKEVGILRAAVRDLARMLDDAAQQVLIPAVARYAAEQARLLAGDANPAPSAPLVTGALDARWQRGEQRIGGAQWPDCLGDGEDERGIGGRW